MSTRDQAAVDLHQFFVDNDLNQVYGSEIFAGKSSTGRPCKKVTFCRARTLDGQAAVFGDRFIVVNWSGRGRDVGARGSQKFDSVDAVKQFIKDNWL